MRKYVKEMVSTEQLKVITCDICKKSFDVDNDVMQVQEFHCIDFVGGYGSVFGDDVRIQCDICQDCLKKLIGQYVTYPDSVKTIE